MVRHQSVASGQVNAGLPLLRRHVGRRRAAGGLQIGQRGHVGAPEKMRAALWQNRHFTVSGKAVKVASQVTPAAKGIQRSGALRSKTMLR